MDETTKETTEEKPKESYLDKYWANAKDKDNRLWDEERRKSAASSEAYSKQQEEAKKAHDDVIERQVNGLLGKNDFSGARNAANGFFDNSRKKKDFSCYKRA